MYAPARQVSRHVAKSRLDLISSGMSTSTQGRGTSILVILLYSATFLVQGALTLQPHTMGKKMLNTLSLAYTFQKAHLIKGFHCYYVSICWRPKAEAGESYLEKQNYIFCSGSSSLCFETKHMGQSM